MPGRSLRALLCVAATGAVLASAGPAAADDTAKRGRVIAVKINTQNSDQHTNFHGSMTLRHASGQSRTYYWGGSTCPGQKLDASQIRVLTMAHLSRGRTWVTPYFVINEGGDKNCLVAFELTS